MQPGPQAACEPGVQVTSENVYILIWKQSEIRLRSSLELKSAASAEDPFGSFLPGPGIRTRAELRRRWAGGEAAARGPAGDPGQDAGSPEPRGRGRPRPRRAPPEPAWPALARALPAGHLPACLPDAARRQDSASDGWPWALRLCLTGPYREDSCSPWALSAAMKSGCFQVLRFLQIFNETLKKLGPT